MTTKRRIAFTIIFLFSARCLFGQQIVPIAPIHNPERGFHIESNYYLHNLENPFRPYTYPKGWIDDLNQLFGNTGDSLSSMQLYIYLTKYVGTDIPAEAFDKMQMLFDDVRRHGYKIVLRFAYDNTYHATRANFTDVFRHLDQLEPFIKKNIGLIDIWQTGFIGAWGEGHSSPMSSDYVNRSAMVKRILDIFTDRQTTIRYPDQKTRLDLPASYKKRMGYNNDYFTASQHPKAPGNDYVLGSDVYKQVKEESPYVKVMGEIPYDENTEWGLYTIISVDTSLMALRDHHYSLFDITQNNELNIAHWKTYPLSAEALAKQELLFDSSYFTDEGKPCLRSAYDYIRDHLGYRLYIDQGKTRFQTSGKQLSYHISLRNVGFSAIQNPRPVYLVFIDGDNRIAHKILLKTDPRDWQPFDPSKPGHIVLHHWIEGKEDLALKGRYKLGLWLPDPTDQLQLDARYAIQLANKDLEVWQDAQQQYKVNILGNAAFR